MSGVEWLVSENAVCRIVNNYCRLFADFLLRFRCWGNAYDGTDRKVAYAVRSGNDACESDDPENPVNIGVLQIEKIQDCMERIEGNVSVIVEALLVTATNLEQASQSEVAAEGNSFDGSNVVRMADVLEKGCETVLPDRLKDACYGDRNGVPLKADRPDAVELGACAAAASRLRRESVTLNQYKDALRLAVSNMASVKPN